MSETMALMLALLAGLLLGAVYFVGLWWTVNKGLTSSRPAQWFVVSLLLRLGLVLSGFYLVVGDDWRRLVACLCGFVIARVAVVRVTGKLPLQGVGHASQ